MATAKLEAGGLGLFVGSLVGLERSAAVEAMSEFLANATATVGQLNFVKLIVECLALCGAMTDDLLCHTPFTDFVPTGPKGMFPPAKLKQLDKTIQAIRQHAVA